MKVLFLVGEEFEDLEFFYPYYRSMEEGHSATVAGKEKGKITGKHGYSIDSDLRFRDINSEEYDLLIIPGGKGPSHIRNDDDVKRIVKEFFKSRKPVGAICHGPQVLISADVVRGRTLTSYISVKEEILNAGGNYKDKEVVVDGNLVSSRHPGDLPHFAKAFLYQIRS